MIGVAGHCHGACNEGKIVCSELMSHLAEPNVSMLNLVSLMKTIAQQNATIAHQNELIVGLTADMIEQKRQFGVFKSEMAEQVVECSFAQSAIPDSIGNAFTSLIAVTIGLNKYSFKEADSFKIALKSTAPLKEVDLLDASGLFGGDY